MRTYLLRSALAATLALACFFPYETTAGTHTIRTSITAEAQVEEYYISCDPADFAYIYEHFDEDVYVPATITHRDKTWTNVQMRLRGDTSRQFPKKSLKLKAEEPFANGRDVLNFNAEYLDNSFIHSILGSNVFAAINYPCFTAEPVRVFLNGTFIGLYISIENMDEAFLTARGLDPSGNLYKATYDGACLSPNEDVYAVWEKKTNENTDRSDLQELIQQINTVPDDQYYDFARKTFDYGRMVDIIAVNMLIGNGSTYYHNYYMYHDPATNKWSMLPWDLDKTLTSYGVTLQYSRSTMSGQIDNPFVERALLCEPIFADIKQRVQELSQTVFNESYLTPIIDSLASVLTTSVAQDTADLNKSLEEWTVQLGREKEYIRSRYLHLSSQFTTQPHTFRIIPSAAVMTPPVTLRWHPATDPGNRPLHYTLRLSTKPYFPDSETQIFNNITDTLFVVNALTEGQQYYWTVAASNGTASTDGYNKLQSFTYRQGSILPSVIQGTIVLTKANSPYTTSNDIFVESGAWLRAEPGAELRMPQSGNIYVHGGLDLQGSKSEPVVITTTPDALYWNTITFHPESMPSSLTNVVIRHGERADTTDEPYFGTVTLDRSTATLDGVEFVNCYRGVRAVHSTTAILNCRFPAGNYGELISIHGGQLLIENCALYSAATTPDGEDADAIDLDSVSVAALRFNRIYGTQDDGIDLGASTVELIGNEVYNCRDKGYSIGEKSVVTGKNNVAAFCATGIAVKDGSSANLDRSTLYGNTQGGAVYHDSFATLTNTIFAQSQETAFLVQQPATAEVRYSLSDTDVLSGSNCLHGNPMFVNAATNDFHLQASSPCIDAGDPNTEKDADGTRADIGALAFNKVTASKIVVINEIAYNPATASDTDDWVELYNPSDEPVDVSGWIFKDEDDSHVFTIPQNTLMAPDGYLVICADTTKFRALFPNVTPVVGNTGFGLAGGGELIRLYDNTSAIVDSLTYDDAAPWPIEPDGNGPTLELIAADYDNALGQSWKASKTTGGTPGTRNSTSTSSVQPASKATLYFLNQNYPNPFAEHSIISYVLLTPAQVDIEIYDATGRPVRLLFSGRQPSGAFSTLFHAGDLPSGQYLYVLRVDGSIVKTRSATVVH